MADGDRKASAFERAKAAIRGKSPADALAVLDRAVAEAPGHAALRALQVEHLIRARRFDAAETALAPLDDTLHGDLSRARLYQARGRTGLALIHARRAHRQAKTRDSILLLAKCLAAAGDRAQGIALLQEAVETVGGQTLRQALAQMLIGAGRKDAARAVLRAILDTQPDHLKTGLDYAKLLTAKGDQAELIALYRRLAAAHPKEPRPALELAQALRKAGEYPAALAALDAAPPGVETERQRLWVLLDLGEMDRAMSAAEALTKTRLAGAEAVLDVARITSRLNRRDLECAVLAQAADDQITSPDLTRHLVERAVPFVSPERLALLEAQLPADLAALLRLRQAQRESDHDTVLARRRKETPRSNAAALDIYRALAGTFRFDLAMRYLSFCLRRWPQAVTMISALYTARIRFGDLDSAGRLLASLDTSTSAMTEKQRGLALSLRLHHGEVLEAAEVETYLTHPIRDQNVCMTLLQHLILCGHYEAVKRLTTRLREVGTLRQRVHWQVTPLGQQSTELFLTQERYGAARLQEIRHAPEAELRREVAEAPWSIVLARFLLLRHVRPDALPPLPEADDAADPHPIPKVIYQYWDRAPLPGAVEDLSQSWQSAPGYRHVLLNKISAIKLLNDEFGPRWLKAFRMAKRPAEEADLLRLCLLAKFGGVWADADDMLMGDLDGLLAGVGDLALFREPISGVIANNFMAARPRHPAMIYAAQSARDEILSRSNETIWAKTGPGMMARAVAHHIARQTGDAPVADLQMRDQRVLRRVVAVHNPLTHKSTDRHWTTERVADPGYGAVIDQLYPA